MTAARKTLGVSRDTAPKADARATFALTGARLERLKERARDQRRHPTPAQQARITITASPPSSSIEP